MELLLEAVFELPSFIMSDQRFDLTVIILCLCINLAEFCEHIREIVMTTEKYMTRLIEFLFKKIEEAAQVEQATDHLLESHETIQMTEQLQDNLILQSMCHVLFIEIVDSIKEMFSFSDQQIWHSHGAQSAFGLCLSSFWMLHSRKR